jgi:hypothetical protein
MAVTMAVYRDSGALTAGHGTVQLTVDSTGGGGGVTYGRNENPSGGSAPPTVNIPIPTTTGTHFSWPIQLYLNIPAGGTSSTHINNRTAALAVAAPTGIHFWAKGIPVASYVAPNANLDSDAVGNGATPGNGYTQEITTTPWQWDNASIAGTAAGQNGNYLSIGIGVDNSFTGGGGTANFPNLQMAYDEGP